MHTLHHKHSDSYENYTRWKLKRRIIKISELELVELKLLSRAVLELRLNGAQYIGLTGSFHYGDWHTQLTPIEDLSLIAKHKPLTKLVSDIDLIVWPYVKLELPRIDIHGFSLMQKHTIIYKHDDFHICKSTYKPKG